VYFLQRCLLALLVPVPRTPWSVGETAPGEKQVKASSCLAGLLRLLGETHTHTHTHTLTLTLTLTLIRSAQRGESSWEARTLEVALLGNCPRGGRLYSQRTVIPTHPRKYIERCICFLEPRAVGSKVSCTHGPALRPRPGTHQWHTGTSGGPTLWLRF
jgi:hypothetical protein